ncbi:hypothetical protein BH20VER1_BH20VER1_08700 [soil metagenome]
MKTLLTASLCSVTFVLTSFAQTETTPAPAQGQVPAVTMTPGEAAPTPAAPPGAAGAPTMEPAVPGAPAPGLTPAGQAPLAAPGAPAAAPAAPPGPTPPAKEDPFKPHASTGNPLLDTFIAGGYIMYPLLAASIVAIAVVLERVFWWLFRWMRRDPKRVEKVFTAIENGDVAEASRLSRGSRDPVLRMMWNGLNHQHASLQGALQVAAGIEIKRAGRFIVVMDTLVTLAPLLGLLGTVTGLMKSFSFLGDEELAVQAVTGGIAEALIATAAGLGIAIFALIPFNYFTSRVSNLEFELQTAATNLEVMLEANEKAKKQVTAATTHLEA